MNLNQKKIVVGVSGSIAAYKAVLLVRLLVKAGAEVKVILTKSAADFVGPLTFSTLSKNKVASDLFEDGTWENHVALGHWADLMLIAPASANTLSKMAHGACDNLLLATYLSATCPVWFAPAMDDEMWHHAATQDNIALLKKRGNLMINVEKGELASGIFGDGRMAEPEKIVSMLDDFFQQSQPLRGKKALVTAGPTFENIDPVRFIGNYSSGKMGIALAEELALQGAEVTLILGPSNEPINGHINTIKVRSAKEMHEEVMKHFKDAHFIMMAAAVADYRPLEPSTEKIKKKENTITIELIKNPDILSDCGQRKTDDQILVGFALETNNERANAREKLQKKNADFIILNSLNEAGAGFGHATNKITIFGKDGSEQAFPLQSKKETARDIVKWIIKK